MTSAEEREVERIAEGAQAVGLTRRDPGNTGPLVVTVDGVEHVVEATDE